jgi:hypothetical protein
MARGRYKRKQTRPPAWVERLEGSDARIDGPLERIEELWGRTGEVTALVVDLTGAITLPTSGPVAEEDPERLAQRVYADSPRGLDVRIAKIRRVRHAWYQELFRELAGRNAVWRRLAEREARDGTPSPLRRAVDDFAWELELGFGEVRGAHRLTGSAGRCCEYDFAWVDYLLVTDEWAVVLHVGELD